MDKIDKTKSFIAFTLLAIIIGLFVTVGKDHEYTRWAAGAAIIIWLVVVFWTNRLKQKKNRPSE